MSPVTLLHLLHCKQVSLASSNQLIFYLLSLYKDASAAPSNVRAIVVNSTVISVQWDGISDCRDVNGRIKWYRVQYTSESSDVVQSKDVLGSWNKGNDTLLTGLTPYTNYTIRVAAVNVKGHMGLYSSPIVVWTTELGMFVNPVMHA